MPSGRVDLTRSLANTWSVSGSTSVTITIGIQCDAWVTLENRSQTQFQASPRTRWIQSDADATARYIKRDGSKNQAKTTRVWRVQRAKRVC